MALSFVKLLNKKHSTYYDYDIKRWPTDVRVKMYNAAGNTSLYFAYSCLPSTLDFYNFLEVYE